MRTGFDPKRKSGLVTEFVVAMGFPPVQFSDLGAL